MISIQVVAGARLEAIGEVWAAFSPASGETHLLNVESAAVFETLQEGASTSAEICQLLANETGIDGIPLRTRVEMALDDLARAGIVVAHGA